MGHTHTHTYTEQKGPRLALYKVSLTITLTNSAHPLRHEERKVAWVGGTENIQSHLGGTWKVYFLDILQMCQKVPSFFRGSTTRGALTFAHTQAFANTWVRFHWNDEFPLFTYIVIKGYCSSVLKKIIPKLHCWWAHCVRWVFKPNLIIYFWRGFIPENYHINQWSLGSQEKLQIMENLNRCSIP